MIPVQDSQSSRNTPIVTYTLILINIAIYMWDRGGHLFGPSQVLGGLAVRPRDIVLVLQGQGDPTNLVTLFTMMWLHGNLAHILGNLLYLYVFGDNIEAVLGPVRFALYYIMWGIAAAATHVFVMASSSAPALGASGAIGGVLGAYFLLFPGNRIRIALFPLVFIKFDVLAWVLLGMWFLFQIVLPQQGVANWAHAGGFLAGMLTVLAMGGREKALQGIEFKEVLDED